MIQIVVADLNARPVVGDQQSLMMKETRRSLLLTQYLYTFIRELK